MTTPISEGYPGELEFQAYQGGTFNRVVTWSLGEPPADVPVDVTGFTATMTVRRTVDAATAEVVLTSPTGLVLGGAAGTIAITIADNVMAGIDPGSYVYDLMLVSAGGETTPLLEGPFTVKGAVTHA